MSHAVVTGAAGFIGSHVVERLLADGWHVTGVDNFDPFYPESVKRSNLSKAATSDRFHLEEADIREPREMDRIVDADVDVLVHLAARAGVRPSIADPLGYEDTNVKGTTVLLDAAKRNGVKKVVFSSSSSVYGNNEKIPFSEDDPVDHPISPYAATKKAAELMCHTYHHLFGLDITCLRLFTVYGPRQRPDLAIHKFARLIQAGQPIPVFGDGSSERDYTYVADIVNGIAAAVERRAGFEIFNLGNSSPVSLSTLIAEIETAMGKKAQIDRQPEAPGDVRRTYADITRARDLLGYAPTTDLPTGLAAFVDWLAEQAVPA